MKDQMRLVLGVCIIFCSSLLLLQCFTSKRTQEDSSSTLKPPLFEEPNDLEPDLIVENPESTLPITEEEVTPKKNHSLSVETSLTFSKPNTFGTITPRERIGLLEQILIHYQGAFSENPIGESNEKIVKQLLGENPLNLVFIAPESHILENNNLVDNWGTPYYFHEVSRQEFEIISSGPDKQRWTDDDISNTKVEKANTLW